MKCEYKAVLRSVYIFKGLSDSDIEYVEKISTCEEYKKDDVIWDELNYQKALGIIVTGRCRAENRAGNKTVVLNYFSAGEVFGATGLFDSTGSGRYSSVIRASTDCKILFLDQNQTELLARTNPTFAMNYIEFLSSKIRFLNGKICGFTAKSAEDKLLEYIKSLARVGNEVVIGVDYTELANILAIGRASLYRAFEELCGRGIIIKNNKKIILKEEFFND